MIVPVAIGAGVVVEGGEGAADGDAVGCGVAGDDVMGCAAGACVNATGGRAAGAGIRGGTVHGIAGATLSTRAVTNSVRRALALHRVLVGAPAAASPSVARAAGD